jgi:hypothetical protein
MKINFEVAKWNMDTDGLWLSIKIPESMKETVQEFVANLQNNPRKHVAEIKQYRKKRSLDANGYMWVILRAMAEKLKSTDKEIYREMIRRVGQVTVLPVKNEAIETFVRRWEGNGEGWQVDVIGECRNTEGYSNLKCYYGSSVYDSREFSILLDEIITEAKELGIETATPEEIERMKQQYERR